MKIDSSPAHKHQFVSEGQKRAAAKLTEYVAEQVQKSGPIAGPLLVQ